MQLYANSSRLPRQSIVDPQSSAINSSFISRKHSSALLLGENFNDKGRWACKRGKREFLTKKRRVSNLPDDRSDRAVEKYFRICRTPNRIEEI